VHFRGRSGLKPDKKRRACEDRAFPPGDRAFAPTDPVKPEAFGKIRAFEEGHHVCRADTAAASFRGRSARVAPAKNACQSRCAPRTGQLQGSVPCLRRNAADAQVTAFCARRGFLPPKEGATSLFRSIADIARSFSASG